MHLGYAGLKLTLLEGNELELDWTALHCTGTDSSKWTGPYVSGVEWTGIDWTEPDSSSED